MILFLSIFITSFILTYVVKVIAQKKMLIDVPNERSSHATPTPRGGGLAIVLTWFSGITFLYFFGSIEKELFYALIAGVLISIVSFLDDIYTLSFVPRMTIQAISAGIALYFIGGLKEIDFGFFVFQNQIILNVIAFFGIMWFTNLFNFIDGINGYSGSGAIFIALALFFFIEDQLLLAFALSVLGFLLWNWGKAKIFMGDIGSTVLGFTVAVLVIHYQTMGKFSIINALIITSVYWFDATFTLFKRAINKEKLSQPHKKHAYQRVVQLGWGHQKTTIFVLLINLLLFGVAFLGEKHPKYAPGFLAMVILMLYSIYKIIDAKKPFNNG